MKEQKVKLTVDGITNTKLFIDDKEIHGVREVKFHQKGGGIPVMTIDLNAFCLELDGQFFTCLENVDNFVEFK